MAIAPFLQPESHTTEPNTPATVTSQPNPPTTSTTSPGRNVCGTGEAPKRPVAVESQASGHPSRPGLAYGCREGVSQTSPLGEYQNLNLNTVPDALNPPSEPSSVDDPPDGAIGGPSGTGHQPEPALALQWNLCGLSTRYAELEHLINVYKPSIIALQEVQTRQGRQKLENSGFEWEFAFPPGEVTKNGAALGVQKGIPHKFIELDSPLQAVAATVEWPVRATFACLYLCKKDGRSTISEKLNSLLDQLPLPVILLGDFNAHSDLWGSEQLDERGKAIEEVIGERGLIVLNTGAATRIDWAAGTMSAIDLSLASDSLARRMSWEVLEDCCGSDHFPIVVRDLDRSHRPQTKRPRWRYDKADWKKFTEALDTPEVVCAEALEEMLVSAAESSIPRTSTKVSSRAVHWWNDSVAESIRARRKALRKLKRLKKTDPRRKAAADTFRKTRNEARHATKAAKAESWTAFVTGLSPELNSREVWRRINTFRKGSQSVVRRLVGPGGVVDDPTEMANLLAEQYYKVSADASLHPEHVQKRASTCFTHNHSEYDDDYYNADFSLSELRWAVSRGRGLSDGVDNIGYPMLRHLPESIELYLLEVLNEVWRTGRIPQRWKEGLVIPIPKEGKDPAVPSNLRPITLVSCVGKTLERMVNRRLIQLLEQKGVLGGRQHGFRSGRGVDSYLVEVEEEVTAAIEAGEHTEMVLLDLAKAYDTAWRAPVVGNLLKWGIGGNMTRYVEDFLYDRTFRVLVGDSMSYPMVLENGVPQGTVIAVTAFLVRMTEVEPFVPPGVELKLYADDMVLRASGKKAADVRKKLARAVKAVEAWTTLYGFQLSAPKSQLLHICRKNKHRDVPPIATDDGTIEEVKNARLLGVNIDSRFRFWKHIENTKRSVAATNRALATLGGHLAAGARSTMLMAQKALVQSKLFFGWGLVSSASDARRNRLEASYNAGIRSASGAFKSSPIPAIMAESGALPFCYAETLALVAKGLQSQAISGTERAVLRRARGRFSELTGDELPDTAVISRTADRPWNQPSPPVDWSMRELVRAGDNPRKVSAAFGEVAARYASDYRMFTDGSLKDGVVGAGIVQGATTSSYRLPEQCSVFSAEAYAIWKGLENAPRDGRRIVVFSDSLSVLSAVEHGTSKHPWVHRIESCMQELNAVLVWIPGHCGIPGNDLADEAARRASEGTTTNEPIPKQDALRWAQERIRLAWERKWFGCREVFLRRIKPNTSAGKDRPIQVEQRALSRLRIGHTRMTHSEKFKTGSKECPSCGVPLTVVHILLDCRRYAALRTKHRLDTNIGVLLSNDVDEENKLIDFLRESGIFQEL